MAGKGGVGKTTVGACLGFAAAQHGYDVLLVELEGYSNLGQSLGLGPLSYEPTAVDRSLLRSTLGDGAITGLLQVMQLKPDEALADYLDSSGMGPLIRRFSRAGAVEVVVAAAPGIRDLVTMGKIRQLEQAKVADLIVVDAPASGHAISFLTSATGMADSTAGGPIKDQADQVLALLGDDSRCQVLLVTLPEETPVSETIETAFRIEDEVGVKLGPVVVNGLWPDIDGLADAVAAANTVAADEVAVQDVSVDDRRHSPAVIEAGRYRLAKTASQQEQLRRLDVELPLPQIHLPQLFTATVGPEQIARLATALTAALQDSEHPS